MSLSRTKRPFTKTYCVSARLRAASGRPTRPLIDRGPPRQAKARLACMNSAPRTSARRMATAVLPSSTQGCARHCATKRASCHSAKPTSGRARAWRRTASKPWANSVASVFKNLRRAGVLKKSSRTSKVVPLARAAALSSPVPASTFQACAASAVRLVMLMSDTDAMAAKASPRKPMVATDSRSDSVAILLVAWRCKASVNSSGAMPMPSSSTTMARTPPALKRTLICVACASSALSTNSRTTEAGRSTTSPAAIWLTKASSSARIARLGGVVSGAFTVNVSGDQVVFARYIQAVAAPRISSRRVSNTHCLTTKLPGMGCTQ